MIILITVPLLLRIIGIICEKAEKKALFLAAVAVSVFACIGLGSLGGFIGADAVRYPLDAGMTSLGTPPAYVPLMKICLAIMPDPVLYMAVIGCINTALAVYAVSVCCTGPYSAAAVLTFCFIPVSFAGSAPFTAALICLAASREFRERRFFRFAALMLAAACFDSSALLLIPLYLVLIIPQPVVSAVMSALIAALAVFFPEYTGYIFDFVGKGAYVTAEVPVLCAVIAVIAAISALLMYPMFKNREGRYETLVPVLSCGAAFTVTAVSDPRFFAPALMLLMMSSVTLAPEAYEIGKKFVGIVFPGSKTETIFLAACVSAGALICAYLVLGDVFGASALDAALITELGL